MAATSLMGFRKLILKPIRGTLAGGNLIGFLFKDMKKEEMYTGGRVKIWNEKLEEWEHGEILKEASTPGFVEICLDDDVAPYRIFRISDLEKSI